MIDLGNGAVSLEEGERLPLVCPACERPFPHHDRQGAVECPYCRHAGFRADFEDAEFEKVEPQ